MTHYFTREEAESLLPAISVVLRRIQSARRKLRDLEDEQEALRVWAMGNDHHLHERVVKAE